MERELVDGGYLKLQWRGVKHSQTGARLGGAPDWQRSGLVARSDADVNSVNVLHEIVF